MIGTTMDLAYDARSNDIFFAPILKFTQQLHGPRTHAHERSDRTFRTRAGPTVTAAVTGAHRWVNRIGAV